MNSAPGPRSGPGSVGLNFRWVCFSDPVSRAVGSSRRVQALRSFFSSRWWDWIISTIGRRGRVSLGGSVGLNFRKTVGLFFRGGFEFPESGRGFRRETGAGRTLLDGLLLSDDNTFSIPFFRSRRRIIRRRGKLR